MTNLSKEISARYGFSKLDIQPLEDGNQKLFDIRYRQDGQYKRAVLRSYFEWVDRKDVAAETVWLSALAADTDLLVPYPIPAIDGTFIQDIDLGPESSSNVAVLQVWLPGEELAENVTPERIKEVGRILACLHNHSASAMDWDCVSSRRQGFEVWVDDWSEANDVAADAEPVLETAARVVSSMMQSISKESYLCGFIHCDPHPWNILVDGDQLAIIDFSDCGWGPYAYDIASALVYYKFPWVWDEEPCFDYQELEAALLVGYASERPIPENLGQALPICFAARLLVLVQWILDVLDDVDATSFTRKSIANSIVHLRQFCRDNAEHQP
jgi:Ser/Thr protein kinase RdoA (MazF antagonist)